MLGGGLVEKLGAVYVERVETSMRRHALAAPVRGVQVVAAQLGDQAVVRGAVALLREALGETA